jgi:hypothetical protein
MTIFAILAATFILHFLRPMISSIKCWSSEYGPRYYLAYCPDPGFGVYETGAIYYGLEGGISESISSAQVIFVGSSKLQAAFSTQATTAYFVNQDVRFYVLGFGFSNFGGFALPVFKHRRASPNVLVVNADPFFISEVAPGPSNVLSEESRTYWRLASRSSLQRLQRVICPSFPSLCSPPYQTIYRSANTGQWKWKDSYYPEQSIAFNDLLQHELSDNEFEAAVEFGDKFLGEVNINRSCVVFTGIPNNDQDAPAIALRLSQRLGTQLILPNVEPVFLLDDYHLNFDTAERWSRAFLSELTPVVQRCVSKREGHN